MATKPHDTLGEANHYSRGRWRVTMATRDYVPTSAAKPPGRGVSHVSACRIEVTAVAAPLTAADRCDRCGAPAKHRYEFAAGELLLCAHHQAEHRDRLPQPLAASSGQAGE